MLKDRFLINCILCIQVFGLSLPNVSLAQFSYSLISHNIKTKSGFQTFDKFFIDSKGIIWLSSPEGIIHYDGLNTQYNIDNYTDQQIHVSAFAETKSGHILIGTHDGELFIVTNYNLKLLAKIKGSGIRKILVDPDNHIWLFTEHSTIYKLNDSNSICELYIDRLTAPINDIDLHLGNLICATDSALLIVKPTSLTIDSLHYDDNSSIQFVQQVFNHNGTLYLRLISGGIKPWKKLLSDQRYFILDSTIQQEDHVVVFDDKDIVSIANWEGKLFRQHNLKKSDFKILYQGKGKMEQVIAGNENLLWILIANEGLFALHKDVSRFLHPDFSVQTMFLDTISHTMYAGTENGLFHISNISGVIKAKTLLNDNILCIDRLGSNYIFGTNGDGLIIWDTLTNQYKRLERNQLPNGTILAITHDANSIWATCLGGIFNFQLEDIWSSKPSITVLDKNNELQTTFNYDIQYDPQGKLWIASDGKGVQFYNFQNKTINSTKLLSDLGIVYGIQQTAVDTLFFHTKNKGILKYCIEADSLISIVDEPGIIACQILDSNIIYATEKFIKLYNQKNRETIILDHEVGIKNSNVSLNALTTGTNNTLYLGSNTGLIQIRLDKLTQLYKPKTVILDAFVNGIAFDYTTRNVFKASENNLQIDLTALHYIGTEHIQYRYRLDPVQTKWNYTKDGNILLNNVSPGFYRLIMQSTICNVFDDAKELVYAFRVQKPWWKTNAFILSCLLIVGFMVRGIIYYQKRKLKEEETLRALKSEMELNILRSQVNPHFLFNSFNTLVSLIEHDKNKAIDYVGLLSDYFRNMLQYRDTTLILVKTEVEILYNYYNLLKLRFAGTLSLHVEIYDMDSFIPPLTLQLLLENVVKHNEISKIKPMTIHIKQVDSHIIFTNTIQAKMSMQESTGFGINNIRERYKALTDQEVSFSIQNGIYQVSLPIIYNAK